MKLKLRRANLTTSIHYARKIQSALFPEKDILNGDFPEHFILFKPLDIVSGDFYWFKQFNNSVFIAASDCTGHGVPGAFMSILGITSLNEIVNSNQTISTGEILNQLRNYVKKTLGQSHSNSAIRDGMEMALCKIDFEEQKIQFSGAFRPIYMIRENELLDIRGDKMPIGIYDEEYPFNENEMVFKTDDIIYLFTDGYVDQIGGAERKTFKSNRFKQLLLDIYRLSMNEQMKLLERKIEEWRGTLHRLTTY